MIDYRIPSGRGLILTGDRQLAGKYVQFAKRRMVEMKYAMSLTKSPMSQKTFQFGGSCAYIRLLSIDGQDFIRIHHCPATVDGGCTFNNPIQTNGLPISEYRLGCPDIDDGDNPLMVTFTALTLIDSDNSGTNNLWQMGQGSYPWNRQEQEHTYGGAQEWETTHQVFTVHLPYQIQALQRSGHAGTHVDAHAAAMASSWVAGGAGVQCMSHKEGGYSYWMKTLIHTIDLGDTQVYTKTPEMTAYHTSSFYSYPHASFGWADVAHGSGVENTFNGDTFSAEVFDNPVPAFIYSDLTSNIGNSSIVMSYQPIGGWEAIINDPFAAGSGYGLGSGDRCGWSFAPNQYNATLGWWNEYKTYKTILIDEEGNHSQVGPSIHERVSA